MRGLFFFQEGVDIQDETDWFFFFTILLQSCYGNTYTKIVILK